jgi:hypothetical protein
MAQVAVPANERDPIGVTELASAPANDRHDFFKSCRASKVFNDLNQRLPVRLNRIGC